MNYKDYYRPKIPPSFSLYNTFAIPTQPTAISMDNTGEANNSTQYKSLLMMTSPIPVRFMK